ncbi:unnamed protein product (macronuclear) [Paramecium tetraurelia]|uniref:VHS domain-containing protein n=1 Tax=Paramecium tetraurelia TaxID=5888 RepID=A0DRS1_PARTE|nr:uncharacterized protein GSPATT00019456001 [Paramecium tetraurelia]CAK85738.1 unnamed protein product [Paramecium tetraurelia]|eukprot:XP_001453135.1 hypothetical protein (macronuclear) [Paramecium tetraurelia strain d4-2]
MSLTLKIFTLLRQQDSYNKGVREYRIRLDRQDKTVYKPICNAIILGFASKELVTSLLAARLGMQAVEQNNAGFNEMFMERCLPYFENIAEFSSWDQTEDRGKYYYSTIPNKEEMQYGKSLLIITLECLEAWARFYPFQSDQLTQSAFFKSYTRLLEKNVKFPDKFFYIKKEKLDYNTSPMFTKLLQNFYEIERKNIPRIMTQTSQIVYKDQQENQTQARLQGEMQEPKSMSTPKKEIQKINESDAQSLINQFSLLKGSLSEKDLGLDFQEQNQDIMDLELVKQNLTELIDKIDIKIEEFLNQDDVNTSLKLLKVYDEIKIYLIQDLKRKVIIQDEIEQQILDIQRQRGGLSSSLKDHETHNNLLTHQIAALKSQFESLSILQQNDQMEMKKMRSYISELLEENEKMKQEIETLKIQLMIEKNQLNNQMQQQEEIN